MINPNQPLPAQSDTDKGKTVAILSYCTLIGWIVAIILHQSDKTKFGAFHIRQGLGLFIFMAALYIVIGVSGIILFFTWFLLPFIPLLVVVMVILGIINASGGKANQLPVMGKLSEKMLSGIE